MVHKELTILGIISILAIGGLVFGLQQTVTGSYTAGTGGDRVYGPVYVQFEPNEACLNSGYQPRKPIEIRSVPYGTMAVCNGPEGQVLVPLVQLKR